MNQIEIIIRQQYTIIGSRRKETHAQQTLPIAISQQHFCTKYEVQTRTNFIKMYGK